MSIAARKLQRGVQQKTALTSYKFGFEAGTAGATVTTAVSASGDTAWNAIGIGSGATLTNDVTHAAHGALSAKLVPTATSTVMRWTIPATLKGAFRYYVWWDAYPTADTIAVWFGSDTSTKVASVNFSTAGHVRAYGTPTPSAYSSPSATLPLGSWARVEFAYQIDPANAANGKVRLAVYAGEATTALDDSGWVTTDLGTAGITYMRIGKYGSEANVSTHWLDSITLTDSATSLLGPAGTPANQQPVANAGNNQTVELGAVVALNGSGSADPDGSIASYAWTQVSGAAVTLSNASVAQPTFTAPSSADTLVFSLVVTDNNGASSAADTVTISVDSNALAYDWSDSNLPWAYSSTSQFTADWPVGTTIVDIQTASGDFYTNLKNTCDAASGRVVVRLGQGDYVLNQFRLIGTSGSQTYAFGFWHSKLQGILGQGPDKTFITMAANSMTQAQLDALAVMVRADFAPNAMGMMRVDGSSPTSPVLLAGFTMRATDQQLMTSFGSDMTDIYRPQPAPHNGLVMGQSAYGLIQYVRFQAAGRAINSAPPFEHANINSQYGTTTWKNCEFDGRRSPALDPARPRRCGVVMVNNETESQFIDCWMHHSNVSRYAANDQNRDTQGQYVLTRTKLEQITNTHNTDPAINGGNTLGGYTNASLCGWESCNGTITLTDCIMSQDNSYTDGSISQHLQFTSVGSRNPTGGRLYVYGGRYHNTAWPQLEDFLCVKALNSTSWVTEGYNTTMMVYHRDGQRLQPYVISTSWPPSAGTLAAAGVTPSTHFLIRNA